MFRVLGERREITLIIDLFLIGLVVTIEPLPLTAMILLLASEGGLMKGLGYVLGWLGGLVAIVAVVVVATGGKPLIPKSSPSTAALAVKLAAGVILVGIAARRRARLSGTSSVAKKKEPKWMARIDGVNPLTAAGLAFLLQPWVLVVAGLSTIVAAKLNSVGEYIIVFAFCVWCSASYLVLETYAALRPEVVQGRLQAILKWINTHRDQAIVILSLALGLYLMAKALYGLIAA
jgi:hypothetical protein